MSNQGDDYRHVFKIGERIKIFTKAPSCYDGKTGVVTEKLDGNLQPDPEAEVPCFYRVMLDVPVDIGDGNMRRSDVHPSEEVFPEHTTLGNYWRIVSKEEKERRRHAAEHRKD